MSKAFTGIKSSISSHIINVCRLPRVNDQLRLFFFQHDRKRAADFAINGFDANADDRTIWDAFRASTLFSGESWEVRILFTLPNGYILIYIFNLK